MEGPANRREPAPHHVHVDAGHEPLRDLGVAGEPGLGPRDLGKPEETNGAAGTRERPAAHRGLQRPADLQDGRAARGVVVGARRLVAEVGGQDDLSGGGIGAGKDRAHHVVAGGDHAGADAGPHQHLFARAQPRAQGFRLPLREHEGEAVLRLVRRQVAPAHEVAIVARPRSRLVWEVGKETRGAAFQASQAMDEGQRTTRDHDATGDLLPCVVLVTSPRTHVHQLGGDVGILAVVGERHREIGEAGQDPRRGTNLFEGRLLGRPPEVAPEVGVAGLPVGGQAFDARLGQAGRLGAGTHGLGRGREAGRAVHPVEASEDLDRLEHGHAVHLGGDRPRHLVGPEGNATVDDSRGGGRSRRHEDERRDHLPAIATRSTSNCSAAFGGIWGGEPWLP